MEENSTQVQMEISAKQGIETTDSSNDSGKENNLPCKNAHDKEIQNGQEPNQTVSFQSKILNHNKVLENRSADVQKNIDKMEIEEDTKQDESSPCPPSNDVTESSDVEMLDQSNDKTPAAATDTNEITNDTNVATKDASATANDTNAATKDTNVASKDTSAATKDINSATKDTNATATDTNAATKDNDATATDTNSATKGTNATATDSDISIIDTNSATNDTKTATTVTLKNSGDAKCATQCEINNDKLTNESQCMDISEKNCEITSVNSNGTDFDKSNKCDTKKEAKEKIENSVEKIVDEDGDELIITMNEDGDDSDVEEIEDVNQDDEENQGGNKRSSDVTPMITLPPLPPLPRTTVHNTVEIPKRHSLISQSLKSGQNSHPNAALLMTLNSFSNKSHQNFQQKSSYAPPVLTPQSSTEMMSLIKWEISNRISNQRPKYQQNQPDNELGPLSKFLFELGNDLVRETVYNDLVRIQTYRKSTGKLSEKETEDLCKLKDVQSELKYLVGPIKHNFKLKCKCGFRTESKNILLNHQEYPHVDENDYSCAVCNDYETKQPAAFMFHMEAMHNMRGRIENKQAFWTCNLCPYENNSKSKLTQHRFRCLKNFNLKTNLSQNSVIGMEVNFCLENNFYKRKDPPKTFHTTSNTRQQSIAPKPKTQSTGNPIVTAISKPAPAPIVKAAGNDVTKKINTLISQNHLVLSQNKGPANENGGFEVCEICGGYVKDRKALRIHFYYAHRKEIPDRAQAPLYCATCFARFWTAQGLQKHLEVHKVTNAAKCLICGHKVPNVLMHMRIVHTKELGNFLATCKCIYCGLVCSSKRGVESHMVGVHGIMIKTESIVTNASMGMTQKQQKQPAPRGCMCVLCNLQFTRNVDLTRHCMKVHHTCMKCGMVVADKVSLDKHTCLKSIKGLRDCELCSEQGFHPAYHVKHIRDKHIRKCTIPLIRLPNGIKSVRDKRLISEVESICKGQKTDNSMEVDKKEQRGSKRPHTDNKGHNDTIEDISGESLIKKPCLDASV